MKFSKELAGKNIEIQRQAEAIARAHEETDAVKRDRSALEAKLGECAEELRAVGSGLGAFAACDAPERHEHKLLTCALLGRLTLLGVRDGGRASKGAGLLASGQQLREPGARGCQSSAAARKEEPKRAGRRARPRLEGNC